MSSRPLKVAYVGFALLGAAVLGAFVYDLAARRAAELPSAPAAPPAAQLAKVPVSRPDFSLKDLEGRAHAIREWGGRPLVVNFWATWCAPCRREIPLLNRIEEAHASRGVAVVGIAVDFADDVRAFIRETPIRYPLLVGEEDGLAAARAFGVETMAFPFTAFTDAKGRIITVHLGELKEAQAEAILGVVARVDAGTLTPVEARTAIQTALKALPAPAGTPASPSPG